MTEEAGRSALWPGDYHMSYDRSVAHRAFFAAIRRQTLEVLESLRDDVLPYFVKHIGGRGQASPATRGPSPEQDELDRLIWDWAARFGLVEEQSPLDAARRAATEGERARLQGEFELSAEWNFFYPWVRFAAEFTVAEWADDGDALEALEWTLPARGLPLQDPLWHLRDVEEECRRLPETPRIDSSPPFRLSSPGWNPLRERRGAARKRILADLGRQLDVLLDQTDNRVRRLQVVGCQPAPKKATLAHFDWLALHQAHGVHDAAALVIGPGWRKWLRRGRPGRPRKP
jgi:hypothetical protein